MSETIAALEQARGPLASQLDALELAVTNLRRIWPDDAAPGRRLVKRRRRIVRRTRERGPSIAAPAQPEKSAPVSNGDAAARHEQILSLIQKSPAGLTVAELRKQLPKISASQRGNSLTALKAKGLIRRAGNVWVKA